MITPTGSIPFDSSLVSDFEAASIDNNTFGHVQHVQVIWSFVHTYGAIEAVRRFEHGLKRLTAVAGHPEKYHATITYAFAFLVAERIAEQGPVGWDEFAAQNPDVFSWPNQTLANMYPDGSLNSPLARKAFVLPAVR